MQIEIEMTLTLMSGCQGEHLVSVIPLMSRYLHTERPRSLFKATPSNIRPTATCQYQFQFHHIGTI